jgi:hypothetical protein
MMNRVKMILLRRSPIRNAFFKFRMLVGIGMAALPNYSCVPVGCALVSPEVIFGPQS